MLATFFPASLKRISRHFRWSHPDSSHPKITTLSIKSDTHAMLQSMILNCCHAEVNTYLSSRIASSWPSFPNTLCPSSVCCKSGGSDKKTLSRPSNWMGSTRAFDLDVIPCDLFLRDRQTSTRAPISTRHPAEIIPPNKSGPNPWFSPFSVPLSSGRLDDCGSWSGSFRIGTVVLEVSCGDDHGGSYSAQWFDDRILDNIKPQQILFWT